MQKTIVPLILFMLAGFAMRPQTNGQNPLLRQYHEGERLAYQMKGVNEGWRYEVSAQGIVKKGTGGSYFEEYAWTNFVSDKQKVALAPASANFRQRVTLDPNGTPGFPDLSQVDPRLIGPITDFMTFYADLWLTVKTGKLARPGDHFYFKRGTPNSWADGTRIVAAQDSIDFDLTFKALSPAGDAATVVVRHVPPENPQLDLPAAWMRAPVAGGPNNWFQVTKTQDGKYIGAVGKETFDVELNVSLQDGKILSASLENPLTTIERECTEAALTSCGNPKAHTISRHVDVTLVDSKHARAGRERGANAGQLRLRPEAAAY